MNKKGKFIAVVNIRSFESMDNGQKVTRWAVKYLCEYNYPHKDGTIGKQQILAEVYYDENPNMQVGPIEDPNEYEMQFFFKVRQGLQGASGDQQEGRALCYPRHHPPKGKSECHLRWLREVKKGLNG